VFIGRDALALLDVAVGDRVSVETPTGEAVELRVADTVYDPSLSPAAQEQTGHGYVSATSLPGPGNQAPLDQIKIQVAEPGQAVPSRDRDAVVAVAGDTALWLQSQQGVAIREVQVPRPYAHPHQWQADALLLSLLAGGAAALLLSTVLVANMLSNLLTRQIPQIGIMKAIGAQVGSIRAFYLAMILAVAGAATLLALLPAVLLGLVAVQNFLGFLGIEPAGLAPSWWAYLVILGVGMGLPPLMALVPLVHASRITVRAAIDHHGGGAAPSAATGLLARLGRFPRLDRGLLMALRNTVRRPTRFLLSVALLASAGTVFVAGMSLSTSVDAIQTEKSAQRTWDVDVQLTDATAQERVDAVLQRTPGVSRVDAFAVLPTGIAGPGRIPVTRTYPDQGHGRIAITALPADAAAFPRPTLIEGRWLEPGDTGAIVLSQVARSNAVPDARSGDTVQLMLAGKLTTWRIVGLVEEREGGGSGVYTTAAGLADATGQPQRVNQLRIVTDRHDEASRQAVAETVEAGLAAAGIDVRSAASISRSEAASAGHIGPVVLILLAIALPLGVVGLIGLASTMGANVLDRTREFGIMHAIGAPPGTVRRVVVTEALLLALISCVVAALPALGLTAILGAGIGNLFFATALPFRVSWVAAGLWLALITLSAVLATDVAAARASRMTVREALSQW
jgi:putative ABC transport system permease protein